MEVDEHGVYRVHVPSPNPNAQQISFACTVRIDTKEQHSEVIEVLVYDRIPIEWSGPGLYSLEVKGDIITRFERVDSNVHTANHVVDCIAKYRNHYEESVIDRLQEVNNLLVEFRESPPVTTLTPLELIKQQLGVDWVDPYPEYRDMQARMCDVMEHLNGKNPLTNEDINNDGAN